MEHAPARAAFYTRISTDEDQQTRTTRNTRSGHSANGWKRSARASMATTGSFSRSTGTPTAART